MDRDETTVTSLPEDVASEASCARLKDFADLFRCARMCKQWSRLVADIRRCRPDHTSSFISGFFVQKGRKMHLIPIPGSVFGPHRRFLGSFCRGTLGRAIPLGAHHGLLLVRLLSSDASSIIHLVVCNLLAGTCDELSPLQISWKYGDSGYVIFTDANCSSNGKQHSLWPWPTRLLFKVLVISSDSNHRPCILHTFSYNEGRWNQPTNLGREAKNFNSSCGSLKHSDAVVCQGMAHWIAGYHYYLHIVDVDAETYRVSLTKIVTPAEDILSRMYDEPQLSVAADETLSLLFMQRPGLQVKMCMRQGNKVSENGD
uniref:F-box domain-containing protein n=1 Tax=Aegilops tauschii TaxID=37682 RepID=R7WD62_AEGTA